MKIKKNRPTLLPTRGLTLPHFDEILNRPQMGVGSFVWCRTTNSLTLGASLWRLLGNSPVFEPVQKSLWELLHVSQRRRADREFTAVTRAKSDFLESLYRMNTANNDTLVCLLRARVVYENRLATRLEGILMDVTSTPRLMLKMGQD